MMLYYSLWAISGMSWNHQDFNLRPDSGWNEADDNFLLIAKAMLVPPLWQLLGRLSPCWGSFFKRPTPLLNPSLSLARVHLVGIWLQRIWQNLVMTSWFCILVISQTHSQIASKPTVSRLRNWRPLLDRDLSFLRLRRHWRRRSTSFWPSLMLTLLLVFWASLRPFQN